MGYPVGPEWTEMLLWELSAGWRVFITSISGQSVKLNILSSTEDLVTCFIPERKDEDVKLLMNILWSSFRQGSATGFQHVCL